MVAMVKMRFLNEKEACFESRGSFPDGAGTQPHGNQDVQASDERIDAAALQQQLTIVATIESEGYQGRASNNELHNESRVFVARAV